MKPIPLKIIGASEDIPRVLLAAGTATCQGVKGYFSYAQRPADGHAMLVFQAQKGPPMLWQTDLGLGPSHAPEVQTTVEAAVQANKAVKAAPAAGPATMKGSWSGHFTCSDDGTPRVHLVRKVAAYGVLHVRSGADGRWTATVERVAKWFGKAKSEQATRTGLGEAITAGHGLVVGLVSEACSFRDTRRRNAVDADYAAQHPPKPVKPVKDPTEKHRLRAGPSHIARRGDHGLWNVVDAYGNVVAAGYTSEVLASRAAKRLVKGASVDEVKPKPPKPAKAAKPAKPPKEKPAKPAKPSKEKPAKPPAPAKPAPKPAKPSNVTVVGVGDGPVDPEADRKLMEAFSQAIARAAAAQRSGAA